MTQESCEVPTNPETKRNWIKYQLKIRGLSLAAIGRKHQITRQVVSTALYKPAPRWEFEIARALDRTPSEIWPERYDNKHNLPLCSQESCS